LIYEYGWLARLGWDDFSPASKRITVAFSLLSTSSLSISVRCNEEYWLNLLVKYSIDQLWLAVLGGFHPSVRLKRKSKRNSLLILFKESSFSSKQVVLRLISLSLSGAEQSLHINPISLAADTEQINEVALVVVQHSQKRPVNPQ
jgi:hypothetical protein